MFLNIGIHKSKRIGCMFHSSHQTLAESILSSNLRHNTNGNLLNDQFTSRHKVEDNLTGGEMFLKSIMRRKTQGFNFKRPDMRFLETRLQSGNCSRREDRTGLAWLAVWSCQGH